MTEIIQRNWFKRTWTIQEVLLAKAAVFLYGDVEVSWMSFLSALSALSRFEGTSNDGNGLKLNYGVVFGATAVYRKLNMLMQQPWAVDKFAVVLREIRPRCAQDQGDKIYGISALLSKIAPGNSPRIDYSLSSQEVYTEATSACIRHDGTLTILRELGLTTTLRNLPSWALDLSNTSARTPIPVASHLDATCSSKPIFAFAPSKSSDTQRSHC
jgi:hypothetical protein